MLNRKTKLRIVIYSILILTFCLYKYGRSLWHPIYSKVAGKQTVEEVYQKYGIQAEKRLAPHFEKANVPYPPSKITLIGLKEESFLEVWASNKLIKTYPFTAFSGKLGPKLKQGDRQIPEGIYDIELLHPNSSYHLSLKVSYPNEFDQEIAPQEGRVNLGGDIFIHGKSVTIGCIPIGDEAIEDLFTLVYKVGKENVELIIAPFDFRLYPDRSIKSDLPWLESKYNRIKKAMN